MAAAKEHMSIVTLLGSLSLFVFWCLISRCLLFSMHCTVCSCVQRIDNATNVRSSTSMTEMTTLHSNSHSSPSLSSDPEHEDIENGYSAPGGRLPNTDMDSGNVDSLQSAE